MKKPILLFSLLITFCFSHSQAQSLSVQITPSQHGSYNISCNGANDGSLSIDMSNGTAPYNLFGRNDTTEVWNVLVDSLNSSSINFNDMQPGTYFLMVTDSLNDTAYANVTLTEPSALEITLYSPSYSGFNIHCNGGSDGEIVANVTGGITPYSYLWSNDSITNSINTLVAGEYSITVTDDAGCTATQSKTLTQPNALQSDLTSALNAYGYHVNCAGQNTVSVDLTSEGGASPYTFTWSSGDISEDLSNKGAGTYTVRIDDNNGCFNYDTIVITEPDAIQFSGNAQVYTNGYNVSCFSCSDGEYTLSTTGGSGSYEYAYRTSGNIIELNANNILSGMEADTLYHFYVINEAGCTDSLTVTLTRPDTIIIPPNPFSMTLTSSLYNGNYNISCFGADDATITLNFIDGTAPFVLYGKMDESQSYDLLEPAIDSSYFVGNNTQSGSFWLMAVDADNDTAYATTTITEPPPIEITFYSPTYNGYNIHCNGGSDGEIVANVTGGVTPYTYLWSNDSITNSINSLVAGEYTVTISDAGNCTSSLTMTLTEPAVLQSTLISTLNAFGYHIDCAGQSTASIDLTAEGGATPYTFTWSSGDISEDLISKGAGNYTVRIDDNNGCSKYDSINLSEPSPLNVSLSYHTYANGYYFTSINRNDGRATATVNGGTGIYTYQWNTGETGSELTGVHADSTYSVVVTDEAGCTVSTNFAHMNYWMPQPVSLNTNTSSYIGNYNVSTHGGSDGYIYAYYYDGHPPVNFLWSNGSTEQHLYGLTAGTYTVTVHDAWGDSATATVTLTEPSGALEVFLSSKQPDCESGQGSINTYPLGGTPPYVYQWSNGSNLSDIYNLPEGTYSLTLIDANNDTVHAEEELILPIPFINISLSADTNANGFNLNCDNNMSSVLVDLTLSGGNPPFNYEWSNWQSGEDNYAYSSGWLHVKVNDSRGCTIKDSINITAPSYIDVYVSPLTYANGATLTCDSCADGRLKVYVSGGITPYTFLWNNGQTTDEATGLIPGDYQVTVTDALGCSNTNTYYFDGQAYYMQPLDIDFYAEQYIGNYNISTHGGTDGRVKVGIDGGQPPYTTLWNNGTLSHYLENLSAGTYVATVTDILGNSITDSITLTEPSGLLEVFFRTTDPNCWNGNSGMIKTYVLGGTPPYSYQWNTGSVMPDLYEVQPDEYTLLVIDANQDSVSAIATINSVEQMQVGLSSDTNAYGYNVTCYGGEDGTINLTITGGTAPYDFWWNDGASTEDRSGLKAEFYSVNVKDSTGCNLNAGITLTSSPELELRANPFVYENGLFFSCDTCNDAQVTVEPYGGIPPYSILWSTGETSPTLSNIYADSLIFITITDAAGCMRQDSGSIPLVPETNPEPLMVNGYANEYPISGNVTCPACLDGSINLNVWGGMEPYSFLWSNGATDQNISGLGLGYYNVTVTDANGEWASQGFNITFNNSSETVLTVNYTVSNYPGGYNVSCYNCTDGWINLMVSGGMPPYQFWWEDNYMETNSNRYGLYAGDYHVRVSDMNGDSSHIYISLQAPSNSLAVQLNSNIYSSGCNGGAFSADLYANVMGGTPPYTYLWSGPTGNMSETWSSIWIGQQGTYYVTVTDANNTSTQASANVFPPTSVNVQVEALQQYGEAHTSCSNPDGRIIIHLSGGMPPYNVNVSSKDDRNRNMNFSGNMATPAMQGFYYNISTSDTLIELDSLAAGWYDVWVNDMSQCGSGNGVELRTAEPPRVSVDGTEYENGYYFSCDTCQDAQMSAAVTGGNGNLQYHWFEIPQEYSSMALKGASLFMGDNKDFNMNELPPAVSTSQTATIANAEMLHGLVVADELGCVGFTNFTLEKPEPVNAWGLKGNNADSTFFMGTLEDSDLRIGTNDTVRILVRGDGNVEIKDSLLTGQVRAINLTTDSIKAGRYLPAIGDSLIHFGETSILMRPSGNNKWIGTNTNSDLSFKTNNATNLIIKGSGNIGIGTTTPQAKLDVNGDAKINGQLVLSGIQHATAGVSCPVLLTMGADHIVGFTEQDECLLSYINSTNKLWRLNGNYADEDQTESFIGTLNEAPLRFKTNSAERMTISEDGQVTIGNPYIGTQHSDYKLGVNGKILAKEAFVTVDYWSDFVFDEDYKLMRLAEVKKYINTNKHLPFVPSEKEVKENGNNLGEMDAILLRKIEELTLYMIEMNDTNEQLAKRVQELEMELRNK